MRFNITYTDYKDQNIITSFFKYDIKHKINKINNNHKKEDLYEKKCSIDVNKEFKLSDIISEYEDNNGNKNYKIDLLLQLPYRKYNKEEKYLNKICSSIYMNVLENSNNDIDKITFMIDDKKLNILDKLSDNLCDKLDNNPDNIMNTHDMMNISVNIYDNIGIIERIAKYNSN
jgi:hypothetical protein